MSPRNALSARAMLAVGIHAQPGVYAVLLGSGVSRPAGIPTGWEIVTNLVREAAAAEDPNDTDSQDEAAEDPQSWWVAHGKGQLGYSSVLAEIAPSSAARQGLLSKYFVASDEDLEEGRKLPTAAHKAIAELVKAGWVTVIVTTNFDRLMEDALGAIGVAPQVISRPEAIKASTPLAHAKATVIKIHGDWADLESRNTDEELSEYPDEWVDLLRRVFNEYGLLISGWSAEWDRALVEVLQSTPRRYPLYWDSRSSKSDVARNLLAQHGGHVIEADSADMLFTEVSASVDALQRLAEPPLTTAMAIARLKRALPDPLRRIELVDLIDNTIAQAVATLSTIWDAATREVEISGFLDASMEAARPVISLLVNGIRYDDGTHMSLWVQALQDLLDARRQLLPIPGFDQLQHYPALLALHTMSIEAVAHHRDDVLIALLTRPRWVDAFNRSRGTSAAQVLHIMRVLDGDMVDRLPISSETRWIYKASHLLRSVLRGVVVELGVSASQYEMLCDDVEYRTGLVQFLLPPEQGGFKPNWGEFVLDGRWEYLSSNFEDAAPRAEVRFRDHLSRNNAAADWAQLLGERPVDEVLLDYRTLLKEYSRRHN